EHAARKRVRQIALSFGGMRIERQGALEQVNRLGKAVARWRFIRCGTSAENIVQRDRLRSRPGGLRTDQREVECDRDAARDLVLQGEQIDDVALEPFGP